MQGRMSFIFETSNQDGKKRYEQPPASVGPTTATDRLHFVVVWHCRFYLGQQQENIIISPESRWAPDTESPGNLAQSPADHRDVLRPLPRGLQSPPGTQQEAEAYSEMQDRLGTPLWGLHQVRRSHPYQIRRSVREAGEIRSGRSRASYRCIYRTKPYGIRTRFRI